MFSEMHVRPFDMLKKRGNRKKRKLEKKGNKNRKRKRRGGKTEARKQDLGILSNNVGVLKVMAAYCHMTTVQRRQSNFALVQMFTNQFLSIFLVVIDTVKLNLLQRFGMNSTFSKGHKGTK